MKKICNFALDSLWLVKLTVSYIWREGQGCDFRNSGLIIIEIDGQQKHNAEGNILKF